MHAFACTHNAVGTTYLTVHSALYNVAPFPPLFSLLTSYSHAKGQHPIKIKIISIQLWSTDK